MSSTFTDVWHLTWRDIWSKLVKERDARDEVFGNLVTACLSTPTEPEAPPPPNTDEIDGTGAIVAEAAIGRLEAYRLARHEWEAVSRAHRDAEAGTGAVHYFRQHHREVAGEEAARSFLENAYEALNDKYGGRLFNLTARFIRNRGVGADLVKPFVIRPNVNGLLARMREQVRSIATQDPNVQQAWDDFENAYSELRRGHDGARIRQCLNRQFILVEALAKAHGQTQGNKFGTMNNGLSYPHPTIRNVAGGLFGFRGDYPGIVHAGNPDAVLRELDMRDLVGITSALMALTPYLIEGIDASGCYEGQTQ